MVDRTLIVARLASQHTSEVADLFAASDKSDLPVALGVTQRHLFLYHGLYFHYVEFAGDAQSAMRQASSRADFQQLSRDLSAYVTPYDPATWRSPADATAKPFYRWSAQSADGR